jgi:UDP-N-acetylmuramoyl-L-alanyl-D-glutamate--2,6-diaminopimelate ligase
MAQRPEATVVPTGLTTPDPVTLQAALRRFVDEGFAAVAVEASSIGIAEHRLAGTRIRIALFTNFTPDHLDYHGSMPAYWAAKRRLFAWQGLEAAVINLDDAQGAALANELQQAGSDLSLWTYSTKQPARMRAGRIGYVDDGLAFDLTEAGETVPVRTRLIGEYNVSNVLAVLGGLRALGLPLAQAAELAVHFTPVPGRMQRVPSETSQPQVVVDYAHTPDALEKSLQALRPLAQARGGQLWCVFGCGGNRDAGKRPVMGGIAARLADRVVITSDNPRDEAPAAIVAQVAAGAAGLPHVSTDVDRGRAIAAAIAAAAPADVLLLAGKGHEDTQEIAGAKLRFSDVEVATQALRRLVGESRP